MFCNNILNVFRQLFETGNKGVFACFKCQPLVPEVTMDDNPSEDSGVPSEVTIDKL